MSVFCTYLGMRRLTPFTHQYPLETQQGIEWGRVDYRPQVRASKWGGSLIRSLHMSTLGIPIQEDLLAKYQHL